jgi:hypothetical protein
MTNKFKYLILGIAMICLFALPLLPMSTPNTKAADHLEAPFVAKDPGADIADLYVFLDPNDNSKVILAMDVEGFVVPAELLNQCCFAEDVVYRFEIENTGDAKPDKFIDVTFGTHNSRRVAQTATVKLPDGKTFQALTTIQRQPGNVNDVSLANPLRVTTDPTSGVSFYAGLTDDPFFFDIIGFNRYVIKLQDRNPTAKEDLTRGRDSFAGFNIHMIALSLPVELLKGSGNIIGVNSVTLRHKNGVRFPGGVVKGSGELVQVDRMATPVINTVLIPAIAGKNEYNSGTTMDDAAGRFLPDILFSFRFIRTSDEAANAAAGLLKNGDFLRLDTTIPNNNLGVNEKFGVTPGYVGFPNGRRPGDDTIDTILFFVNSLSPLSDSVDTNDRDFGTVFPFFAQPHQPPRKDDPANTRF